jgi:hypothetical protein
MADSTPGDDQGTGSGATTGQSAPYAPQGGGYPPAEAAYTAAYEQSAQAATPEPAATPAGHTHEPFVGGVVVAAAHAAPADLATGVALAMEATRGAPEAFPLVHLQREPAPGGAELVSHLPGLAEGEVVTEGTVTEQPDTAHELTRSDPSQLAPQQGSLLVGALPIDLTTLNRAVDNFFVRFEGLAADGWSLPATGRLVPWVMAALLVTGAFEVARRRLGSAQPHHFSGEGDTASWDPSSVLALLPAEEAP